MRIAIEIEIVFGRALDPLVKQLDFHVGTLGNGKLASGGGFLLAERVFHQVQETV